MHLYHGSMNAREKSKMSLGDRKLCSLRDSTTTIRIRLKSQRGRGNDTTQEDEEKLPCKVAVRVEEVSFSRASRTFPAQNPPFLLKTPPSYTLLLVLPSKLQP